MRKKFERWLWKRIFFKRWPQNAIFWKQIIFIVWVTNEIWQNRNDGSNYYYTLKAEKMAWFHAKAGEELAAKCNTSQNLAPILKYV